MGKKIKNKQINNLRDERELAILYLYETLMDIEEKTTQADMLRFFDRTFEDVRINEITTIKMLAYFKNLLIRLRSDHCNRQLMQRGYQSHEWDESQVKHPI